MEFEPCMPANFEAQPLSAEDRDTLTSFLRKTTSWNDQTMKQYLITKLAERTNLNQPSLTTSEPKLSIVAINEP